MRIALITETFLPEVNGVVTTVCRLLEHFERRGHEALLFAQQTAPQTYAGAEVVRLQSMPLPLYPGLSLTPPQPGFVPRLRAFQPDILHLAGSLVLGATGRYAATRVGVPLVATYHTDWPAYCRHYGLGPLRTLTYNYLRWVHNGCALTFCPSSATLADLRAHGFRRLRHWARGVDTQRFHPAKRSQAWRESVGAKPDETILLYVGRLASEKRLDLLADAIRGLEQVRLVVVGHGPERTTLERRLAGAPVSFTGFLNGEALATAYASADLFVFPSDTETFGQVIQEAMASGLPVVAAQAGGALDLVREGQTGLFFPAGNAARLREQIRLLAQQPALRQAFGITARQIAERRSWNALGDEMLEHYQRAIHGARRRTERARQLWRKPLTSSTR